MYQPQEKQDLEQEVAACCQPLQLRQLELGAEPPCTQVLVVTAAHHQFSDSWLLLVLILCWLSLFSSTMASWLSCFSSWISCFSCWMVLGSVSQFKINSLNSVKSSSRRDRPSLSCWRSFGGMWEVGPDSLVVSFKSGSLTSVITM